MIGQVVFSNVMFTVTGAAATISNIIVCRWGMGALGASTDLNSRMAWLQAGLDGPMYDATVENLTHSWQMLGLISVVCLVAAWLVDVYKRQSPKRASGSRRIKLRISAATPMVLSLIHI